MRMLAPCAESGSTAVTSTRWHPAGPATTKSTTQSNEVSFKDVIKAIKQLVDTQVGNSKPLALPRAAAVETAEPPLPAAPPPQQRALDVPEKSYLGYRGR